MCIRERVHEKFNINDKCDKKHFSKIMQPLLSDKIVAYEKLT